ncbi:DUF3861 domain-containing protein [Hymenobacter sp. HSC-4F20]|uniref:DUF3861 domain-containing protein n=1 Tax=Hymenobacter sp. HSC-4F20 TaxID=2864135 RepID=UPI001C736A19|nr:DUF3861 domain-containing protein [Hymenobacter sp. HSC-4F20]MBX0289195.1 DUF3861 domain-containing protein [Hymenobacter sp. HSC-4F20]
MSKKQHQYRLTLEHQQASQPDQPLHEPLTLAFANHDDVFAIIERIQQADVLPAEEAATLAVGLKLLGNVLLAHRGEPLFAEFGPAYGEFLKKLKGQTKPQE